MARIKSTTYDLSLGNAVVPIQVATGPLNRVTNISYQLSGDNAVNGTVTVKLQETNIHGSGQEDIVGASGIADQNTNEYVGAFSIGGGFLNFEITLGTATLGFVTITVNYL